MITTKISKEAYESLDSSIRDTMTIEQSLDSGNLLQVSVQEKDFRVLRAALKSAFHAKLARPLNEP